MAKSNKGTKHHVWSTDTTSQDIMLAVCKGEKVKFIVETGTCVGSSSLAFSEAGMRVATCDIEDQRDMDALKDAPVEFVLGDVNALVKHIGKAVPDAAFIDGDHSYAGLAKDFKALEKQGVKLFFVHDCYGIADVKRFCEEQFKNPHYMVTMIRTQHFDGYENGLAILKRI